MTAALRIATEPGRQRWYRMHDSDNRGAFEIPPDRREAQRWNEQGFGIFWTLNEFDGPRQISHLTRIRAWAVDMDSGTKEEMFAKLHASPLVPSLIVETKRGFQAYWSAKDARPEHWNAIVLDRLVAHYGADANARDLARILRVPGFKHLKDPADPFLVRDVWRHRVSYTERQIVERYEDHGKPERDAQEHRTVKTTVKFADSDGFWDRVWALDCKDGLERLSGHPAVRGEQFTFRTNRSGTQNVYVDGKGSSAWVDANGRIGSLSHGGPTLYQWLRWYGNSPRECVDVLKRIYPDLERRA